MISPNRHRLIFPLLALLLALASGCTTNGVAKIIAAAAKDNATVHARFSGWGVQVEYDRNMPQTAQTNAAGNVVGSVVGSVTLTPVATLKVEPAK